MKRNLAIILALVLLVPFPARALDLRVENRTLYDTFFLDGQKVDSQSGWNMDRMSLAFDGNLLAPGLSYSGFFNFNKPALELDALNCFDWLKLIYNPGGNWYMQIGKDMLEYGTHEFYAPPVDLLLYPEWYALYDYAFNYGVSFGYWTDSDMLTFQVARSPFVSLDKRDIGAFSLSWRGWHGPLTTQYSVNLFEYDYGKADFHIALGNRLDIGKFEITADFIHRFDCANPEFMTDWSVVSRVKYAIFPKCEIFVKGMYDFNSTAASRTMPSGIDYGKIGGGLFFYPISGTKNLRLHLMYFRASGVTPVGCCYIDGASGLSMGLTWKLKLL